MPYSVAMRAGSTRAASTRLRVRASRTCSDAPAGQLHVQVALGHRPVHVGECARADPEAAAVAAVGAGQLADAVLAVAGRGQFELEARPGPGAGRLASTSGRA